MADWVRWDEIPLSWIKEADNARRDPGNQRTKQIRKIKDILCAWDIETATVPGTDQAAVYHWQFQLGKELPTIYGRYIEDFRLFLDRIVENLDKDETLVIYVHNLHYEFEWIHGLYDISQRDVFAVGPRKPVRVWLYDKRIELRCSYIMTNRSLKEWTVKMGVPHAKKDSEEYDHTLVRYPWTELTELELEYCRNDVLGLVEALEKHLELHGDTLATIPLTSTGLVRRDVKRCMKLWSHYGIQKVQPTTDVYLALREAFRGGNTHASRWFAGDIISNVHSADRSSSYPDVCVNSPFPMGKLTRDYHRKLSYLDKCIREEIPFLVRLRVEDLQLKDPDDPCPYISYSKTRDPSDPDGGTPPMEICRLDNGRVMTCEFCDMTIIDVDWRIIREHYLGDWQILDLWTTTYDFLPDILRRLIIQYYEKKTGLKGVEGQELEYDKSKALLNSIYGLMAQDPCKQKVVYSADPPKGKEIFYLTDGDIPALLAKSRSNPYTTYQWSCWVCGWARYELQLAIDAAGYNFIYCDTDSVKYIGELDLSGYNKEKIRSSTENGAYATDPKGRTHYMGVFEDEGIYPKFITMGAKKYAFEDNEGKINVTVSGVNKKAGALELAAAGGLEAFKEDFVFSAGGGMDPKYNDRTNMDIDIDGHRLHIGPNICLRPSTYTLSLGRDYGRLIHAIKMLREEQHDIRVRKALEPEG